MFLGLKILEWLKIAGVILAVVLTGGLYLKWRADLKEKGRREAIEEMDKEGKDAQDAMRDTEKPRDEKDTLDRLDSGRF